MINVYAAEVPSAVHRYTKIHLTHDEGNMGTGRSFCGRDLWLTGQTAEELWCDVLLTEDEFCSTCIKIWLKKLP